MNGGNDSFSNTGNLAALIKITGDGGAGNDTILGSNGIDLLLGGDGDDFVDGQQGNDVAFLGGGDDVFQWDPGDGSDVVEGQGGNDTMVFNGSSGAEIFEASANGSRLRFTRNLGSIVMDVDDVETLDLNAGGNTDTVIVNDLSPTDLISLNVELESFLGSGVGDALVDTIIVNGTAGADSVEVQGAVANASIAGLAALVTIEHADLSLDRLSVNLLGGNDTFNSVALPPTLLPLTVDGGDDADAIVTGAGGDTIVGGAGNDTIDGNFGNDTILAGTGDDTILWNNGDGNDAADAQAGTDTLIFTTSGSGEAVGLAANGTALRITRTVGPVTMDVGGLETVRLNTVGGIDTINVENVGVTGLQQVVIDLDLSFGPGTGDDTVNVNALGVGSATVVFDSTQAMAALNIGSGGTARLTPGGEKVLVTDALNMAGTARLDLSDGSAILDYAGGSPIGTTRARLQSGFAGGAWTGAGINSSAAAADPTTRIGYAEATDLFTSFPATFKGQPVDNTAVLLTHTVGGDATLDGAVTIADFSRVASNFNQSARFWAQGDFDYNGLVGLADFSTLASNFGQSGYRAPPAGTFGQAAISKDVLG
jgi:hypothetical protein